MNIFKIAAVAATLVGMATGASALSTPNYSGQYDVGSVVSGGNSHAFWLPGFQGASGADRYWQFIGTDAKFTIDTTAKTATLTGTIQNNVNTNDKFTVSTTFDYMQTGGYTASQLKCGGSCADIANWDLYDLAAGNGTLTGMGDLAGTKIEFVRMAGSPPGQLGIGANDKKPASDFGFSSWITWTSFEEIPGIGGDIAGGFQQTGSGKGDINIVLTNRVDIPVTAVPVPAPLVLMLSSVALIGFVGRRKA
ncbi:MAG: hypothetical protein AAFR93_11150 [Pseudomonadota bacterium]